MRIAAVLTAFAALTVAAPALAQTAPAAAPRGDASIRFDFATGAATGKVMVALYNSADAYSGGAPVRAAQVDVASGAREAVFVGLPAGDYAMKAFHDVNGDGRMNTNPFGMPTEPFAFSNNARGNMGPASWDRAHFAVSGEVAQTITIR